MLIVKATGYSEAGINHYQEHDEAMIAYKESLAEEGVLLATEELLPSSTGVRILYPDQGGKPELQAGPFSVDEQLIAEYALIDVRSEDEALNWALRMPVPTGQGKCQIELRKLAEHDSSLRDPSTQVMEVGLQEQLNMLKNQHVQKDDSYNESGSN